MSNKHMPTSNVMKNDFGWEIPVESIPLPSNGIIYDPDSLLYNCQQLKIKAMTAREEDILSSQAFIKDGTAITKTIQSCLEEKSINVDDLIIGDRNALMISIRITGYGSDYNLLHSCRQCGSENKVCVKLNELSIKRLAEKPVEEGKNMFEFALPVTRKKVLFKFINGHDEREQNISRVRLEKAGIVKDNTVTSFLESTIVKVDDITDKNKIRHFIENMPALDSRKLRLHILKSEPGIDMDWQYNCQSCLSLNEFGIPITSEFFWPST